MSTRPRAASVAASRVSIESRRPTSTGRKAACPPLPFDLGHALPAALGMIAGHDDRGAGRGEALGQRPAQHAGAADDHGHLARQAEQVFEEFGRGGHGVHSEA